MMQGAKVVTWMRRPAIRANLDIIFAQLTKPASLVTSRSARVVPLISPHVRRASQVIAWIPTLTSANLAPRASVPLAVQT